MTERTIVDLVEDWQTGFFLLLGSAVVGILGALVVGRMTDGGAGALAGFVVGGVLAFVAISYLLYGR